MSNALFNSLFNLKMTSKNLTRQAAKADKDARAEQVKVKKALSQNPPQQEIARIYANNAVRNSKARIDLLTLAARVDAVAAKVQLVMNTKNVQQDMTKVTIGINRVLERLNPEHVATMSANFDKATEDMDILMDQVNTMAGGVEAQQIGAQGQSEVDALMAKVADEAGIELNRDLREGEVPTTEPQAEGSERVQLEEDLGKRLRGLRAESS